MNQHRNVKNFPTGSKFTGAFIYQTHSMEGFGNYRYPDGSEYRGYFDKGLPHGFGKLSLAHPYRLRMTCHFNQGELVFVEPEMKFHDGLDFFADVSADCKKVDLSRWNYLRYVYKQTCRDILDRNIEESNEYVKLHPLCHRSMKKLHKYYLPGVCDPLSSFDPNRNEDEVNVCYSKGSTCSASITLEDIADDHFLEQCKEPTGFDCLKAEKLRIGAVADDQSQYTFVSYTGL